MDNSNKNNDTSLDSLEGSTTVVQPHDAPSLDASGVVRTPPNPNTASSAPISASRGWLAGTLRGLNIYLLLFVLLLVVAGAVGTVLYLRSASSITNGNVPSQSLSQSALNQLSTSDVSVGEPQHTLNVQSNAVFTGSVLVRSNLQIAGSLQVGNNLALNGLRVTGNSVFDDVQISKSLALTGNASIQGQLNIQQALNVNGTGTFSGAVSAPSLTIGALQLNGDLNLTHHIAPGGGTPGRSNGTALGSGGTTSVSGSDTAGSITINEGASPAPGCFITVTFATAFNATPHVIVTPVGVSAAGLAYYITRSTTNFSVCTTSAPPASTSFGFDYAAFD